MRYIIIVTRQLSIKVGPQTLPATREGITGMLTSKLNFDKHDEKGLASMCAPISQGHVKLSTMVKGGCFGTKYPSQSPRALAISDQTARLLVKDLRPYSMVERDEFVCLVKILDPW